MLIVLIIFNAYYINKCMRLFRVLALPDSWVDGRGRYKMVSNLKDKLRLCW
jgi:hypothetical protein